MVPLTRGLPKRSRLGAKLKLTATITICLGVNACDAPSSGVKVTPGYFEGTYSPAIGNKWILRCGPYIDLGVSKCFMYHPDLITKMLQRENKPQGFVDVIFQNPADVWKGHVLDRRFENEVPWLRSDGKFGVGGIYMQQFHNFDSTHGAWLYSLRIVNDERSVATSFMLDRCKNIILGKPNRAIPKTIDQIEAEVISSLHDGPPSNWEVSSESQYRLIFHNKLSGKYFVYRGGCEISASIKP